VSVSQTVLLALCFLASTIWAAETLAAAPSIDRPVAVLRILDKVTARVEEIEVWADNPYKFGTLFVTMHSCRETQPEEPPESAAFLDVTEIKAGQEETPVFKGWMFASSPALSALEHPVYDLWLMRCRDKTTARP